MPIVEESLGVRFSGWDTAQPYVFAAAAATTSKGHIKSQFYLNKVIFSSYLSCWHTAFVAGSFNLCSQQMSSAFSTHSTIDRSVEEQLNSSINFKSNRSISVKCQNSL